MKKIITIVLIVGVVAVAAVFATKGGGGETLGKDIPSGMKTITIAQAYEHAQKHQGVEVVLKGTMEEKCPTSGCWFYLTDGTGKIRVDTQFAGFNVIDQKTGSEVTVYGKLLKPESGEPEVSALGARF